MFVKPCHGIVTSLYSNSRLDPVEKEVVRPHWGMDYGTHSDNTIAAAASGTIRFIDNTKTVRLDSVSTLSSLIVMAGKRSTLTCLLLPLRSVRMSGKGRKSV